MDIDYLVIGAGGIGGSIAGTLAASDKNVTLIARGPQLEALSSNGIVLTADFGEQKKESVIRNIDVCDQEAYIKRRRGSEGRMPPVIFICVKSYSIPDIAPFLNEIGTADTIMIPILNGMCMGEYIRRFVRSGRVLDGCTYLSAMKDGPGRFLMKGDSFRLVFGGDGMTPSSALSAAELGYIAEDLRSAGIDAEASDDILSHSIRKASFVAASAGTGLYFDIRLKDMQRPGEPRDMVGGIAEEMQSLARSIGVSFGFDLKEDILRSLDSLSPDTESSLQRDIAAGGMSEFDSLILNPLRIGKERGIDMPTLQKVADRFLSSQKKHIRKQFDR